MHCTVCELRCSVAPGATGKCGMYENIGEHIVERYPDRYLVTCPISIETMPVLHFRPGGKFLQVSTAGCNFDCPGCISRVIVREMTPGSSALRHLTPDQVVNMAVHQHCEGIVFLMNDPLASLQTFLRLGAEAKKADLLVGCASNGSFTLESLIDLVPMLDFITVGIKGLSDEVYRSCGGTGASPVWRNLNVLHQAGVHVEASCILRRDNGEEIIRLAHRVAELSRDIPLMVMRFIPLGDTGLEQEPTIREAEGFCRELRTILPHVYLFNSPGTRHLDTVCPGCGQTAYVRDFYGPMGARLTGDSWPQDGVCPHCGYRLPIRQPGGPDRDTQFRERDFEGGYPFTRALEMIEALLIPLGVDSRAELVRVWEQTMNGGFQFLHTGLQTPRGYIDLLRHFGSMTGRDQRADMLATWLEKRLHRIETALTGIRHRPRVCYVMGKALFCINGGRMENELVQIAGGYSVNRELCGEGRPGRTITTEELTALAPDVMFVSAFLSSPVEDLLTECRELGLNIPAARTGRIHAFPAPGWDFGSPRWILGLMHIANTLHPECCSFDLTAEAETLYRCFYGTTFCAEDTNRSFGRPTRTWNWKHASERAVQQPRHDHGTVPAS